MRVTTIIFSKRKARQKRDEEKELLEKFKRLQEKIWSNFSEVTKAKIDRVKSKLSKIIAKKTQGTMIRSRARWYEHGVNIFSTWRKGTTKKKTTTTISLTKEDRFILREPKQILN